MPGIDVRMMSYGERVPAQDRYNSEESLEEENQSTTSSTESRQSDFAKKDDGFIPTRRNIIICPNSSKYSTSSGILAGKPASNAGQFTRINSNPLLISAQKQMLLVEEVKKKKKEVKVGEDTPDWQSNLDGWKLRRRKQSEEAIVRVSEIKRVSDQENENGGRRKSSLGRKISLQIENDDQIDFDDLGNDDDDEEEVEQVVENTTNPRRESRGVSQEKAIPEEEEEEEEEAEEENKKEKEESDDNNKKLGSRWDFKEDTKKSSSPSKGSNPYQSAIEGYKSFAQNHSLVSAPVSTSSKESSPSSATSSLSSSSSSCSPPRKQDEKKGDEEWEEKIETFVQPARRVSSEVSATMRQKMASFSGGAAAKEEKESSPVTRPAPVSDNKFQDKLKAFKTIETAAAAPTPMSRRESEPVLGRPRQVAQMKTSLTSSSSSSSFMNTMQNAKFFQQNSLGSEEPEEEDKEAMEDALEESFNVLEGDKEEQPVFSADDFSPRADGSLPPAEKPPPLPAVPPPPLDQEKEDETEIEKQEREIIESLEREEKEHKKYLQTLNGPASRSSTTAPLEEKTSVSTQSVQASSGPAAPWSGGLKKAESQTSMPVKKKEKEVGQRDYSKHWLIQEAEQRRIAEAKQKQNLNHSSSGSGLEKIENVNNNNSGFPGDKRRDLVSDNIYANVDASNLNFNKNHGEPVPQVPGPQVPPRLGESGDRQDRVLSVSGKKRCSHCKEELGRGAAMIIESLRLFYHIRCFKCCVCSIQLGNGEQGTDVRVRNNRLHCQNCYSNDEGLKFSKV